MIRKNLLALGALSLALAACGGKTAPVASVSRQATVRVDVGQIEAALMRGDEKEARKLVKAALKADPMNPQVQLLRDSIERKPVELLGPQSYAYTVRGGDTVAGLAERLLGNRLKAYQLARYNDLAAPFALSAGQTVRIPGTPPRAEPVRRADPAPRPAAPVVAKPAPRRPAPAPVAVAPASNPVLARQLRAEGLAALNQGAVVRATTLLRRAAAADRANPLIARDLARAERIAATVRARK